MLQMVYISYLVLVLLSGDMDWLYRLGPTEQVPREAEERHQSLKHYVLNETRTVDMSRNTVTVLIHPCHKHLDLIS
jgi:hypothetical protein